MPDDTPNNPLASLENYTLGDYILFLQNYACYPIVDSNQAIFGTFIANHVIKESLTCIIGSPWSHLSIGMYGNQGFMSL
jgi:hypothetical protein